jgi:hypothetical protein
VGLCVWRAGMREAFSRMCMDFLLARFGMFYFKQNRLEDGRFTFTRALQSLDKRDIVETSVKFAQIEFKYGDSERGIKKYRIPLRVILRRGDFPSNLHKSSYNIETCNNQCCGSKTIFFRIGADPDPIFVRVLDPDSDPDPRWLVKSYRSHFGSDPKYSLLHNANKKKGNFMAF